MCLKFQQFYLGQCFTDPHCAWMIQACLMGCRNNSPAIKPVLEKVKQGFLHHVRHLKKTIQISLTFVTRAVCFKAKPAQQFFLAALTHLITFKGGAHQNHRPHGGYHIVWGHVLRLSMTSHPSEDCLPGTDVPPTSADLPRRCIQWVIFICPIANINIIKQQMTEMEHRWQVVKLS